MNKVKIYQVYATIEYGEEKRGFSFEIDEGGHIDEYKTEDSQGFLSNNTGIQTWINQTNKEHLEQCIILDLLTSKLNTTSGLDLLDYICDCREFNKSEEGEKIEIDIDFDEYYYDSDDTDSTRYKSDKLQQTALVTIESIDSYYANC